jgi:ectoine hydroxylase-related dioxygenase (phytanoyl-CoA dioxygenase family)
MKLSDDDRAAFHEGGFVVLRGLFSEAEVAPVRAAFERLYDASQALRATGDHDGAFFVLSAPPEGPVVVQRVVWAGGAEPELLRLSEDLRLVDPALELLGAERCEQLLCQAHFKMPNDGVAFDWHQDIQHRDKGGDTWRAVPGRSSYVQTILLVDDMTTENGPLEFLPTEAVSLDPTGRLFKDGGGPRLDASRAVSITGRAGDVLVFGPYAVHGSSPNLSSKPRRVLINGYAAPGVNGRFYPGRGACRVLPAGSDLSESAERPRVDLGALPPTRVA